jgi:hypothetical protein
MTAKDSGVRKLEDNFLYTTRRTQYRIDNPKHQNDNSCSNKELHRSEKGAYKAAYKQNPKKGRIDINAQILPSGQSSDMSYPRVVIFCALSG